MLTHPEADQSRELQRWMTARLQEGTRGAHILAASAVCFVTVILYAGTRIDAILHWAAYLLVCEALLGICMLLPLRLRHWIRLYSVFHLAACAGWGVVPLLFLGELPEAYQSTYALIVVSAAVVSQPTMSYAPKLYLVGVVLMLLPVAIGLLVMPGDNYGIAVMLAVFLVGAVAALAVRTRQSWTMYRHRAEESLSLRQARKALREHQLELQAEQKRAETAGNWDPVTGTRSQAGFLAELHERGPRPGAAAICFKIAGFKYVNMAFGHQTGDEVLREMAARLVKLSGHSRFVCRTGGGEFLTFMEREGRQLERDLLAICDEPCLTSQGTVMINAYIGLSSLQTGEEPLEAVHTAIHAAEEAKRDGDKAIRRLAPADVTSQRNRSLMRFELRDALEKNEFHLVYQPQHRQGSRELTGFEALLRWESSVFGPVSPGEFIPVAEEAGLIRELGNWVVRNAIHEFKRYFGARELSLSINVSLYQLESNEFVESVRTALEEAGLPANRLTLEITESTFMASPAVITERLNELRKLGARISLDDFGTGYSSLSYLAKIPLDEVKIDRTFIHELAENHVSHTLVNSLLNICQALGLQAVIEGVEYKRQIEALSDFPDIIIQGFIFSRPVPVKSAASYAASYIESV